MKRWKNWWYYYKWYVITGIVLFGIICNVVGNALGVFHKTPDFQVAYIGKTTLPDDTVSVLERAFASIASDFNGDGEVIVQVNQYINGIQNPDAEAASYEYASEISLMGDISDCQSYFFLMENPAQFQLQFQILAEPDGSCPDDADYSAEGKTFAWTDCPLLSQMELGTYSSTVLGEKTTGSNQELLSGLFLGRRCFYTDAVTDYAEECDRLWKQLRP